MKANFKLQVLNVAMMTRPLLEMPTDLLLDIRKNLSISLDDSFFDKLDPILVETLKATWREEIRGIEKELMLRN